MILRFAKKYLIILLVEFFLLVIIKGFLPDLATKFSDYDSALDLILYLSDSLLPVILNIIVAVFLVYDMKRLEFKNILIPLLSLINPIAALFLLGFLLVNNDLNTIEK
jgi:hypothetical protein